MLFRKFIVGMTLFSPMIITATPYNNTVRPLDLPKYTYASYKQNENHTRSRHPIYTAKGASITTPNALGNIGTSIAFGFSSINHTDGKKSDGNFSFGLGFGNAKKLIGIGLGIVTDTANYNQLPLKNTSVSLRINRYLTDNIAAAIGVVNFAGWNKFNHLAKSYYGAITFNNIQFIRPISLSLGLGSGTFVSPEEANSGSDSSLREFASLDFTLTQQLAMICDWSADRLSAGLGYFPQWIQGWPIIMTASVLNIAGNNSESKDSISVSIAIGHTLA